MKRVRLIRPVYDKPQYERAVYDKLMAGLRRAYRRVASPLRLIQNASDDPPDFTGILRALISSVDSDVRKSVQSLVVMPALSKGVKEFIAKTYSNNLKLHIKKFTDAQIKILRARVEEMQMAGARQKEISKVIQASFGVSERRARFLARQETNLLTAKLKEARYREVGIDEYYWQSVAGTAEHPVRPVHKELNARSARGETFRFSNPPRSGTKGEKQNPGEPFNCRCIARPVVKF
jgi:SPP1 gp7 family putative phage head morphogenesis protein